LSQFEKHIDAMNLLVAGKISGSVAMTFWDQTRVAAVENVAAFRKADKALGAANVACTPLTGRQAIAASPTEAKGTASCAAAVSARGPVLRNARIAVSTWEHHVHAMEALRQGKITATQAVNEWRRAWKTGDNQLTAYQKTLIKADKTGCPLA
jgi:hypothetical protein